MILLLFNTIFLILFYLNSKRLSLALGLYKKTNKTPIVGGLGIYLFFLIQLSYLLLFGEKLDLHDILIIVVISLIFFIGIIDDIINLDYKIRLSSIFIILIIFLNLENSFLIKYLYFETLNLTFFIGNASYIITPLFIILFLNSMNMADGINGNSGTIFLTYFIIFYIMGNENIESLLLILIPIIIFLIFNMNNKLYLGDSGSYFIGLVVGFLLINIYKQFSFISSFYIILLLWYPCFENLFSILRKYKFNLSPLKPDNKHLHHLLFNLLQKKYNLSRLFANNLSSLIINFVNIIFFYIGSTNIYNSYLQLTLILALIVVYSISYSYLFYFRFKLKN